MGSPLSLIKFTDEDIVSIIDGIAAGAKNIFLYMNGHRRIEMPYIPVPGYRQIIYFFKRDPELAGYFQEELADPEKNIMQLKDAYIMLNYSGDIKAMKELYPCLPADFILKRALGNSEEFGIMARNLEKVINSNKRYDPLKGSRIVKALLDLARNANKIREIWKKIKERS